jgi:hypothetical protein
MPSMRASAAAISADSRTISAQLRAIQSSQSDRSAIGERGAQPQAVLGTGAAAASRFEPR